MAKLPEYFHFRVLGSGPKVGIQDVSDHDFVEVVRCRDCVYSDRWYADRLICTLWNEHDGNAVFEDGFCNYGKKREES